MDSGWFKDFKGAAMYNDARFQHEPFLKVRVEGNASINYTLWWTNIAIENGHL